MVVNKEVTRTVDLSSAIVRVATSIDVAGMEGEYIITFPKSLGDYLSYLRVVWDDEEQEVTVSGLDEEQHFFDDDGNYNFALDTGDLVKTKFIINAAFTNKVKPFSFCRSCRRVCVCEEMEEGDVVECYVNSS